MILATATAGAAKAGERYLSPNLNWGLQVVDPTDPPNIQPRPPIILGEPDENPSTQPTPTLQAYRAMAGEGPAPAVVAGAPLPAVPTPGTGGGAEGAGTVNLFGTVVSLTTVGLVGVILLLVLARRRR